MLQASCNHAHHAGIRLFTDKSKSGGLPVPLFHGDSEQGASEGLLGSIKSPALLGHIHCEGQSLP